MSAIGVIGGGAFGTALANVFASGGNPVRLWCRDADQAAEIQAQRENAKRLPGIEVAPSVMATSQLGDVFETEIVLMVLPAQQTEAFLAAIDKGWIKQPVIFCAKGISVDTLRFQSEIGADITDRGVLTGPGFAQEIAAGLPTALTLAAEDRLGIELQSKLARKSLRIYRTDDLIGAQIGGAVKNVIAIAAGVAIGAGLGESAKAALMTRGFAEMRRLAVALGAREETLSGLSGLGDLALTCGSQKSRNFSFGISVGSATSNSASTVEGIATANAVQQLASREGVDMPITDAVAKVLTGAQSVGDAMANLLARPQVKEEAER